MNSFRNEAPEHVLDNAQCGEKSGDFGSVSDQLPTAWQALLPKHCLWREDMLADRANETAVQTAARRARWLAELAQEIDQAQRLARRLSKEKVDAGELAALGRRLEAVRQEVEELRRGSRLLLRREIDPKWMGLVPWDRRGPG